LKVLVIGANGHIGKAATAAIEADHEVIAASRSGGLELDLTDPASVERALDEVGTLDAVICAMGSVPWKPFADLAPEDYEAAFTGKVMAQIDLVRLAVPHLNDGGVIVLTTGILARTPVRTGVAAAMANGAIESFVIGAAAEMPRGIRLNAVSPTVLAEATGYHPTFEGFEPVPGREVGQAFRALLEGEDTGKIVALD
jgi:NAD(P)-dependent dehydrogenase (short-subunit alcohol dehydrogenase family)